MIFDYAAFCLAYPELFSRGTPDQITQWANDAASFVPLSAYATNLPLQQQIWFLATAHMIELRAPQGNSPAAQGMVGRLTSASEGSVSLSVDGGPVTSPLQAWFMQTKYGAMVWSLTTPQRRFRFTQGYPRQYPMFNPLP